jgi:drug/metabolite transporter (DMT)-like permease
MRAGSHSSMRPAPGTHEPALEIQQESPRPTVKPYRKFGAMIATSTIVIFGLLYLSTYQLSDVFFSETWAYTALIMGSAMAIIVLGFTRELYLNRRVNLGIFAGSAVILAIALWLLRSQGTVADVSYMRAMIPHHSAAILSSRRARISDPRVRRLAEIIISFHSRQIEEMKELINDLEGK